MTNTIEQENALSGSPPSAWGLLPSTGPLVEGYAGHFSINAGQQVDFKINTFATSYRIEIYRMGYYGGDGARLVDSFDHVGEPTIQPSPLVNSQTGLVDAGNWLVTDSWQTPSDMVSGIYIAKVITLDGSSSTQIPFVIKDASAKHDVLIRLDDATWQAYNSWGGHSLYDGTTVSVSYNRPIYRPDFSSAGVASNVLSDFFNWSYPTIRWFERNGFDVSYVSSSDVARDPSLLLGARAVVSLGHDEYWSSDERGAFEAARGAGVNLLFLGGNDVYWKTRWGESLAGDFDSFKTLTTYKTTESGKVDPSGVFTGLWRDPGSGLGPENELVGTLYSQYRGVYPNADMTVDSSMASNRFWSGTEVELLTAGQSIGLGAYIGHEANSDINNGYHPRNLIHLTDTTGINPTTQLEYSHNLTLYRAASGALVFSGGSLSFGWALDAVHGRGQAAESMPIQQAMVNLLADMGVQPASLRSGLNVSAPSADAIPASLIVTSIDVSSVPTGLAVSVSGTAVDFGGGDVAGVQYSLDGGISWQLAQGTSLWSFTGTVFGSSLDQVRISAIDDSVRSSGDVLINGRGVAVANGTSSNDVLFGDAQENVIIAGAGNDVIYPGGGQDSILGGPGFDVVMYSNDQSANVIAFPAIDGSLSLAINGVTSTLQNVESAEFSDGAFHLSTWSTTGQLTSAGAHQQFSVNFLAGQHYTLRVNGVDNNGGTLQDPTLRLLGGNAVEIAFDDNSGLDRNAQINFVPRVTGNYILEVGSADNTGVGTFSLDFDRAGDTVYSGFGIGTGGWLSDNLYHRTLADVNGDGLADVVGFGSSGVYVALANDGGGFGGALIATGGFGTDVAAGYWESNDRYPRDLGDVNGDGRADIIGFGASKVYVALGQEDGTFGPGLDFGSSYVENDPDWETQGGSPRMVADVNGDGLADVVGFGQSGVFVATSTGSDFSIPKLALASFGTLDTVHNLGARGIADVNGDGFVDVVGFGEDGVYVALGTGSVSFQDPFLASAQFTKLGGWTNSDMFPRQVADINGDGLADLIGFGSAGTWVALNATQKGTNTAAFASAQLLNDVFNVNSGWNSQDSVPRVIANVDGSNYAVGVGFKASGIVISPLNFVS